MSGNENPYDPSVMFREWIQKSGQAQADFVKSFGALMGSQKDRSFDPLETLREISDSARQAQSSMMQNISSMQHRGMDAMFGIGQMLPSFLNWGAYKTTISSNGRISIPEAERSALGLGEGDLVQVVILPIAKKSRNGEVKD